MAGVEPEAKRVLVGGGWGGEAQRRCLVGETAKCRNGDLISYNRRLGFGLRSLRGP
jgi:hypothetical protein